MKYVIEQNFTYGWDFTKDEPTFYDTVEEAQAEIDDLIDDTKEAFEKGDMGDAYDPEDYRVGRYYEGGDFHQIAKLAHEVSSCASSAVYLEGVSGRQNQLMNLKDTMERQFKLLSSHINTVTLTYIEKDVVIPMIREHIDDLEDGLDEEDCRSEIQVLRGVEDKLS